VTQELLARPALSDVDAQVRVLHGRVCVGAGGGPEQTILSSAPYLAKHGVSVRAAYLHRAGDAEFEYVRSEASSRGTPLHAIVDRGPWSRRTLRKIEALCEAQAIDVWHGHDYKSNLIGLWLRRRLPLRLVTTVHGWVHRTRRTPLYFALDRWAISKYDQVVAVADDLAASCVRCGVDPRRLQTIENAFDPSRVRARAVKGRTVRSGRLRIVSVGRLSSEKGLDLLLDAVARLGDDGLDVCVTLAGVGDEESRLRKQVADLGLTDRVEFMGFVKDVADVLASADIFAMPSRREGLPQALIEAMAAGLPAVAARAGGVPEMIEDGANGILVECEDRAALHLGLRRLVVDPDLRARIGREAARRAGERFSYERRSRLLADVYRRAMASGGGES